MSEEFIDGILDDLFLGCALAAFLDLAERDLDGAMRVVIANSLIYLRERGLAVAPETLAALDFYHSEPSREKRPA